MRSRLFAVIQAFIVAVNCLQAAIAADATMPLLDMQKAPLAVPLYKNAGAEDVEQKADLSDHESLRASLDPADSSNKNAPSSAGITKGPSFKVGPVTDDEKLIKPVSNNGKESAAGQSAPTSPSTPQPPESSGNFKKGTDFKVGPVTDDTKLIKPVEKDAKEKPDSEHAKSSTEGTGQQNMEVSINDKGPISVGALKIAKHLDMIPLIMRLEELKKNHQYVRGQSVHGIEVISVRQDLDETLFAAFLQTRRVISELDRQIAGYDAVARVLEEKRDDSIRYNNILNFTSAGALTSTQGGLSVGTRMKFQNAGNELAAVAGGVSALISAYALKLQKGGKRSAERDPNMLAPIFGLVPVEPNKYPPAVWDYINDYEPGQKKSRREQLVARWIKLNYIEALDKASSHSHLSRLSGTVPLHKEVTIDMLRDRIPMLEDVRATVAGINEYLDEILTFIRQP